MVTSSFLEAVTTTDTENSGAESDFDSMDRQILDLLKSNKLLGAYQKICKMVALAEETEDYKALQKIDQVLQVFTSRAFLAPYKDNPARRRIMLGMDAMALQLTSGLAPPYNAVPQKVFLDALRAVTAINESGQPAVNRGNASLIFGHDSCYSAYRILQRLVTGAGIRRACTKTYYRGNIQEKVFNIVLNSVSNLGRMDMAHKIVTMQEHIENAPPLSPVAYSILLKGYGRLGDLRNVDMILTNAIANEIVPDAIMLNSLIDAYVNCNAIGKAKSLFNCMAKRPGGPSISNGTLQWLQGSGIPKPTRRTYNTMLKGLAQAGSLTESLLLSQEIQEIAEWDAVTTNTLVHAAVLNQNFTLAESLLNQYTVTKDKRQVKHPNVEAYTELLDGYSKAGDLKSALRVMQTMNDRNVEPTEVTYTCLVAAFARHGELEKARKILDYMERNAGLKPSAVTYNAFISALLALPRHRKDLLRSWENGLPVLDLTNDKVDEAVRVFYDMIKAGISPDHVSVTAIVVALGRCRPTSRVGEAKALVTKLEDNGVINIADNEKVATALMQACSYGDDVQGVLENFQKLRRPDLVAVNTLLAACCRCNDQQAAMQTFGRFFEGKQNDSLSLEPDVVTFSIIICALLRSDTCENSRKAQELYERMKTVQSVSPDKTMVDLVVKTIVRNGNLQKKDFHLTVRIVRDAESLDWMPDELEQRKRAIECVLGNTSGCLFSWGSEGGVILRQERKSGDSLFQRKGWNRVDSGFRFWGGGRMDVKVDDQIAPTGGDKFLESKGWNNVDSGFRIIY